MFLRRVTQVSPVGLVRLIAILTAFLLAEWALLLAQGDVLFVYWRRTALILGLGGLSLLCLLAYILTWTRWRPRLESLLELPRRLTRLRSWNLLLFLLSVLGLAGLYLLPAANTEFSPFPARMFVFWLFSLLGAFFLSAYSITHVTKYSKIYLAQPGDMNVALPGEARKTGQTWFTSLLVSLLVNGSVYKVLSYLGTITAHPFSLNWSEATRYYHASLLFSKTLYGFHIPPFFQDFSRYLLEAIPFLLPAHSLLMARAWESILWVGLNTLTAWTLVRRFPFLRGKRVEVFLFFCFIFLFIFQGPIYYYLLPCVFLILWGFDARRFPRSLVTIMLASIWAGLSRINWIPIPAMLALALHLLEVSVDKKPLWKYLFPPAALTVAGLAVAWPSRLWFMRLSEVNPAVFNAAFDSPLFFYRLFPTSMYAWGVLPTALLVSIPAWTLLYLHLKNRLHDWHWIRLAGLGLMLILLLAAGLVVSTKIGGGANLHNLDGYLSLLTVIVAYILLDRFVPEQGRWSSNDAGADRDHEPHPDPARDAPPRTFSWLLLFLLVAVPLVLALRTRYPRLPARPVDPAAFETVAALQKVIDESAAQEGEVLFITQRQLLTFGLIQNVPMAGGYDNVDLMEYAIMGYPRGLEPFYRDLAAHRFKLIIAPYQSRVLSLEGSFAEESYSWYVYISKPLMKYYQVKAEFKNFDFLVLEPIP